MNRMAHSPVHVYCCKMLDQLLYDDKQRVNPYIAALVTPTHIRHSVMLAVTTDVELLSQSRRTGQFAKLMSGGGEDDKSCMHNYFACRNGLIDEFGIGFNNPAVLDVSPPILTITAPHSAERKRGDPYTIVWVQYCLLDAGQIKRHEEPVNFGHLDAPSTDGKWGHYFFHSQRKAHQITSPRWVIMEDFHPCPCFSAD